MVADIPLLHHERHLHVSVAHPAVVVADRGKGAGRLRRDRDLVGTAAIGVEIDAEGLHEQAVRVIGRIQPDRDRLAAPYRDDVRRELESLRADLDDARLRGLLGRGETRDEQKETETSLHDSSPCLSSWATPFAPEISRFVSSMSSIARRAPESVMRRMPRLRNGWEASKGSGFFSAAVAGSGKAKMSDRAT